ncbi:MAG: outer membrane protein transport protein [Myxococcaceae bacterium]|nr:outer membrane protein transport protein [Myxococcaceae bacterium]
MSRSARVALVACVVSASALADVLPLYGYGPRAAAMGGAMTAEANDFTAVFYNPALLIRRKDLNFGFSFQFHRVIPEISSKDLAKPIDCSQCQPPDNVGTTTGFVFPIAGKVKNRLAIGLGLYLPTSAFVRVNAPDATRPYWYRYNGNIERFVLHVGAGIKITDWLSVGPGVSVLATLQGRVGGGGGALANVDLFSRNVKVKELDAALTTRLAPTFGISVTPLKQLRFGATYRWEIMLPVTIPAIVELEGIGNLNLSVNAISHWSPHQVSFGAAWDITEQLTVSLDGEYQHWSSAPSPYVSLNVDLAGPTLAALGIDKALDLNSPATPPGFVNTLGFRLGGEYRVSERFAARLGGSYRPTPVPLQNVTGSNLLDGNAIGLATGIGFNFPDPLEVFEHPIQIDVAAQMAFILGREATKPSFDVLPSYTYAAKMFGGMAMIRYDF